MTNRPPGFDASAGLHADADFNDPLHYTVLQSPRTYGHLVMSRTTLDRIVPLRRGLSLKQRVGIYLGKVRRRWVDLVTYYVEPPLPRNELVYDRFQSLLNCPPPYAFVMPRGFAPCRTTNVCPSCHARGAAERWSAIDRGLFGDKPPRGAYLAGVTVLMRRVSYRFWRPRPCDDGTFYDEDNYTPLAVFLDRRLAEAGRSRFVRADDRPIILPNENPFSLPRRPAELTRWKRFGVVCGFETTRVGSPAAAPPGPGNAPRADHLPDRFWNGLFTSVLFAPREVADRLARDVRFKDAILYPGRLPVDDRPLVEITVAHDPGRKDVARAVAKASAYSAYTILRGDRATLTEYLEARHNRQLVASFGDPGRLSTTSTERRPGQR